MLFVQGLKTGKPSRTPPPPWLNAILLARRAELPLGEVLEMEPVWDELLELVQLKERSGIPIRELMQLEPIWVERLKEYYYHCSMQGVRPF